MANITFIGGRGMDGLYDWAGYGFHALGHHDGAFIKQAGLFGFVRRTDEDRLLLFIGHSELIANTADPAHPAWGDALALGMNELHVFTKARDRTERLMVLHRVVRRCTPLLNVMDGAEETPPVWRAPQSLFRA